MQPRADQPGYRGAKLILLAEDDAEDQALISEAVDRAGLDVRLETVSNGQELLEYLQARVAEAGTRRPVLPRLILIDLRMPLKTGQEALQEIKADPLLRRIPMVVLTVSSQQRDIWQCYDEGANAFITKPLDFDGMVHMLRALSAFWFDTARTPGDES